MRTPRRDGEMRPFPSLEAALAFYFRWAEALRGGKAIDPGEVRVDGGRSVTEEIRATYLSVELCTRVLTQLEMIVLGWAWAQPGEKLSRPVAGILHRAKSKLGREMRRRGVVG